MPFSCETPAVFVDWKLLPDIPSAWRCVDKGWISIFGSTTPLNYNDYNGFLAFLPQISNKFSSQLVKNRHFCHGLRRQTDKLPFGTACDVQTPLDRKFLNRGLMLCNCCSLFGRHQNYLCTFNLAGVLGFSFSVYYPPLYPDLQPLGIFFLLCLKKQ